MPIGPSSSGLPKRVIRFWALFAASAGFMFMAAGAGVIAGGGFLPQGAAWAYGVQLLGEHQTWLVVLQDSQLTGLIPGLPGNGSDQSPLQLAPPNPSESLSSPKEAVVSWKLWEPPNILADLSLRLGSFLSISLIARMRADLFSWQEKINRSLAGKLNSLQAMVVHDILAKADASFEPPGLDILLDEACCPLGCIERIS